MVYYLNEIEHKLLMNSLRPKSRNNPIQEELRGWNWQCPPLKPYYDVKLPMYLICSNYCPTKRDVYVNRVEKKKGEPNFYVTLGSAIHKTLEYAFQEAKKQNFNASYPFENKYEGEIDKYCRILWEFILTEVKSRLNSIKISQPYARMDDLISTSIPFLIEHKMDGSLLGCSGLLSVDCYDYLNNIVFDVKTSTTKMMEEYKLYTTGYAMVLESIYEIPVDIGCTVMLNFSEEFFSIKRELYYINDDLRSWWLEERDKKAEIVYEELDPGIPEKCNDNCIYLRVCLD